MASRHDERYAFQVEWYDPNAQLMRKYMLCYYVEDATVEMYEVKNRRIFLKRTQYPSIRLEDLYISGSISIYSRQLTIKDYADDYTRNKLDHMRERSIVAIPYGAQLGTLIDRIVEDDFSIHALKMVKLPRDRDFINFADAGRSIVCMEITGAKAVDRLRVLTAAVIEEYGEGSIYASSNVYKDFDAIFGPKAFSRFGNTAALKKNTLCILKPHTVRAGSHGKILDKILSYGFEITAMEMFAVERANAEEFFEVYKGVVPEFNAMVTELISGKCIALEITKGSVVAQSVVDHFRDVVGPADPGIARHIRPESLRATFGVDKVKNALHCTDLSEDGGLEAEYFFRILPSSEPVA